MSRLFKARYFPCTNFLEAQIGGNPSFVWRSICEANDLIKSGVRWVVGTGEKIDILNQPWLLDEQNPCITTLSQSIQGNKVSSLMHMDRKAWDIEILEDIFNTRESAVHKVCSFDE